MDKYSILAIFVIAVMIIFPFFGMNDDSVKIDGIAADVNESESGFTFYIQDVFGNSIRSFSSERPDESLHSFHGRYSDDGRMFFVSRII